MTLDIEVFADHCGRAEWRVEYSDGDGGRYVTIFAGSLREERARDYADALKAGKLPPIPTP